MYNGITIPVKVVEGNITIANTVSVTGDSKKPVVANPVAPGDKVAITGDFRVEKADGTNGTIIGFVHDHPEYSIDPTQAYTKAQAISAGMLRECGVETAFTDVREVTAKASEGIVAGDYVEDGADGQTYEKASDATNMIALSAQDAEDKFTVAIR